VAVTAAVPLRTGIVLAGGRSSRLGRPKALLELGGEPLVARVVRRLAAACAEIVVVAAPRATRAPGELEALEDVLAELGRELGAAGRTAAGGARDERPIRIVHDALVDRGPVAGLAAGLAAASGEHAFVSACDAPFLAPALVGGLFALAEAAPETDVVICRTAGGLEPLVAVYRAASMAPHYAAQLADGELRPTARFAERRVCEVGGAELEAFDPALESFAGVNDAAEYDAARRRDAAFSARERPR
jgi:molybdopterin-guanine dinucleotide biosynthesis protein A